MESILILVKSKKKQFNMTKLYISKNAPNKRNGQSNGS